MTAASKAIFDKCIDWYSGSGTQINPSYFNYGSVCSSIMQLRRSILLDIAYFLSRSGGSSLEYFYKFFSECELIARCKILFKLTEGNKISWVPVEEFMSHIMEEERPTQTGESCI